MNNIDDNTKTWGIVELMGHKVVAGLLSKSEMLGKPMLRIDVPTTTAYPQFTQFYGDGSIYCVTFVSEEVARLTAEQTKVNPVSVYVPDLITKQRHEEIVRRYQEQLETSSRRLPEPADEEDDADDNMDDEYEAQHRL